MAFVRSTQGQLSQDGSDARLADIERRLNSVDLLPAFAFRRNHEVYELVGYVNCLLGCRLAGNTQGEGVFKDRISQYMASHAPTPEISKYYQVVSSYVGEAA